MLLFSAPFSNSLAIIEVIMYDFKQPSPYPIKHYRGFMQLQTCEDKSITVIESKRVQLTYDTCVTDAKKR